MKEMDPVGGAHRRRPPGSANGMITNGEMALTSIRDFFYKRIALRKEITLSIISIRNSLQSVISLTQSLFHHEMSISSVTYAHQLRS